MAASMIRTFRLVQRTKSSFSPLYLTDKSRSFGLYSKCFQLCFRSYSYAAGTNVPKYDRERDIKTNRRRFQREDAVDEYSEHHLAEGTSSKLEQLARQHREEAVSEGGTNESKTFSDFSLEPSLIQTLDVLGYKTPFPIQTGTLEYTLNSRDVIGRAVTGSGKTLAFAIPIVNKLRKGGNGNELRSRSPRAIVMAPTRELCNQIYRSIQELDSRVRCVALYGGASYTRQEYDLHKGVDVICATPGRLNDHLDRGNIDLKKLEFLCLDEADEMLTPNFREQIHDIFIDSPKEKQVLMFSATMPSEVRDIAQRYLKDPVYVDITDRNKTQAPANIEHHCMKAHPSQHVAIVANLLAEHNAQRCIIFVNTKVRTNGFAHALKHHGLKAEAINSDLSQNRREAILSAFRLGDLRILCATDVAARGLDIPETDLVIQVGPPDKGLEFYIHRSGRTGRAGRKGLAVLLHSGLSSELDIIRQISRAIPMKQISPPANAMAQIQDRNLKKALEDLKKVSQEDITKLMPTAEQLLKSEQQDSTSLLAAALALLSHSENEQNNDHMRNSSLERGSFKRPMNSYSSTSNNFGSHQRRQPYKPNNRRNLMEDDDDGDYQVDVQRYR